MSKKFWTVLLLIFCIIGAGLSSYLYLNKDKQGPEIQVPSERILYHAGDSLDTLLEGVTARDNVDGDVTDSLMVEAIYPSANETTAKVVYAAMDSSNNVTKVQRMVNYSAVAGEPNPVISAPSEAETETAESDSIPAANQPASNETEPTSETESETESGLETDDTEYKRSNIALINGSSSTGVAGAWMDKLEGDGYSSISSGNYSGTIQHTTIYTKDEQLEKALKEYFPNAQVEEEMPVAGIDITLAAMDACVVIGEEDKTVTN